MKQHINSLSTTLQNNGYDLYGSFNEGDFQHDIFTCLSGQYSGNVCDIYYNYNTGEVIKIEYSKQ